MLDPFSLLVKDQFEYGAVKYRLKTDKEVTDLLVEQWGLEWILGTMHKYVYRYTNLGREKDLLKIACYAYLLWLKFGFNQSIVKAFLDASLPLNPELKSENFPKFVTYADTFENIGCNFNFQEPVKAIETELLTLKRRTTEVPLFKTYLYCRKAWKDGGFDGRKTHDRDTWNEAV